MKKLLVLIVVLISSMAAASQYPADTAFKTSCQDNGPVKVCRGMQIGGDLVVTVYYKGVLANAPQLGLLIQANYQDGARQARFSMATQGNMKYVRVTNGCLVASPEAGCKVRGTPVMGYILFWGQRGTFFNALSLDVAFFNPQGDWDNNGSYGNNYHFQFPGE
jgi:hypothetical protein